MLLSRCQFLSVLVRILLWLSSRAVAQAVEANWIAPIGTGADFQQTFTNGKTLAAAWKGWNSTDRTSYLHAQTTKADLWVTVYLFTLSSFSLLLSANVDISQAGSYSWDIDIDAQTLSDTAQYILRFTSPGQDYHDIFIGANNIPSLGFIILPGPAPSSSSKAPTMTTTTSTSSAASSTLGSISTSTTASDPTLTSSSTSNPTSALISASDPTPTSASDSTSTSTPTSTSLSSNTESLKTYSTTSLKTTAIIGIAVGSAVGGTAAIILIVLALRRHWRSTPPPLVGGPSSPFEAKGDSSMVPLHPYTPRSELPVALPEFATSSNTVELPGSYGYKR